MTMSLALLYAFSYLLGAIPFGYLIAKAHGVDIFKEGSGNPGATNVIRVLGPKAGIPVFVLDVLKGVIPAVVGRFLVKEPIGSWDPQVFWMSAGMTAVIGHSFSVFLKFKGGKGIASALGMLIGAAPIVALGAFAVFSAFLWGTRYMGFSSTIGGLAAVIFSVTFPGESRQLLPIYLILFSLILVRHRKNYQRMREGTEPKFSFRKTSKPPEPDVEEGTVQ